MPAVVTVDARVVGSRKPLISDWQVDVASGNDDLPHRPTLRELIRRIVLAEVRAFDERQEQRRLPRVLSKEEIDRAIVTGKVDSGGRPTKQHVDADAAVATALQAFEDGLYYVFVDGDQKESLDQEISLRSNSRLTFLRLVALAGG